ncbi:MAG: PadR family transcriptional regulator [Nocardioides sp.]|nr:PadR family transcriptional regulator [Nocardioides sp.]
MGRDWGREFESMWQQHARGQGGWGGGHGRGGEWSGPWGSWQWGPPGRRSGPPPWLSGLFGLATQEPARGPRVRRGDVRMAILAVLADGPLNGYQVIQEIGERTGGAWRPSPGSVYPTIAQLEDEGLVEGDDERGRRTLRLSDAGRTYLADHEDEVAGVWAPFQGGTQRPHGEDEAEGAPDFSSLKPELGRVMNAVWQIITTGTDEQRRAAVGVLLDARRGLYRILADDADADGEVDDLGDRPGDDFEGES